MRIYAALMEMHPRLKHDTSHRTPLHIEPGYPGVALPTTPETPVAIENWNRDNAESRNRKFT